MSCGSADASSNDESAMASEQGMARALLAQGAIQGDLWSVANRMTLSGWACAFGNTTPVSVHIYAGGPYNQGGTWVAGVTSNLASSAAVRQACGVSTGNFNFSYTMPYEQFFANAGKKLYVYGVCNGQAGCNTGFLSNGSGARRVPPLVFIGYGESPSRWREMIDSPNLWSFVRQNVDGFHFNFIDTGYVRDSAYGLGPGQVYAAFPQGALGATASRLTHKYAYFESDIGRPGQSAVLDQTQADDQDALNRLGAAGFVVPFTSLNTQCASVPPNTARCPVWSTTRAATLRTYALGLGQSSRKVLIQSSPWLMQGNINNDPPSPTHWEITWPGSDLSNAAYRNTVIYNADGASSDGPVGFWLADYLNTRTALNSWMDYARSRNKTAVAMISTYEGTPKPSNITYDPATQFLTAAQQQVRAMEAGGQSPDIWVIYAYGHSLTPAVPETSGGQPAQTTTGFAYWLIQHLNNPQAWP